MWTSVGNQASVYAILGFRETVTVIRIFIVAKANVCAFLEGNTRNFPDKFVCRASTSVAVIARTRKYCAIEFSGDIQRSTARGRGRWDENNVNALPILVDKMPRIEHRIRIHPRPIDKPERIGLGVAAEARIVGAMPVVV